MKYPLKARAYFLKEEGKSVHDKPYAEWSPENQGCDLAYVIICDDYATVFWTGLKDKNGIEIYEGDILENKPYEHRFVVEWGHWSNDDLYLASGYEYENDGMVAGWNITFGHQYELDDDLKQYEVIGNINSNPELLKQPYPTTKESK